MRSLDKRETEDEASRGKREKDQVLMAGRVASIKLNLPSRYVCFFRVNCKAIARPFNWDTSLARLGQEASSSIHSRTRTRFEGVATLIRSLVPTVASRGLLLFPSLELRARESRDDTSASGPVTGQGIPPSGGKGMSV